MLLLFFCAPVFAQDNVIDSLTDRAQNQHGSSKVSTLNQLSSTYRTVDNDLASKYAQQALLLSKSIKDRPGEIESLYNLGAIYSERRANEQALKCLKEGLEIALEINDLYLTAEGYLQLGYYFHDINQLRKSIDYLNMSIAISEKNDFQQHTASSFHLLGTNYDQLSLYESSLRYYFKSLRLNERLKNKKQVAKNFNSIGKVYQHTQDFDDALDYFSKALALNSDMNDAEGILVNTLNTGVIYQKEGDFEKALSYYQQCLPIARELGRTSEEAIITGNIGSTFMQQGKLELGLEYLLQALAIKEKIKNHRSILHTLNDIAEVKILLNDPEGAKEIAERVILLAKEYEDGNQLGFAYRNLSESYKKLKLFELAYVNLERYNTIKDSLFGIKKAQQINELQIDYETEKKDQAISSLRQEKEIADFRKKVYFLVGLIVLLIVAGLYYNQRLKSKRNQALLEKEKEVDRLKSSFFANISHEFRTPLTLILGPIETMLSNNSDPDQNHQLGIMKKSASRLLRLINQILDLSKLESGHLELKAKKSNIVPLVKGIIGSFQSMADSKAISLSFKCDYTDIHVYFDRAHMETILINLISNAFKFSDKGGSITVDVNKKNTPANSGDKVEIKVIDNGVGISSEQINHIFDRFYQAGHATATHYGGTGIGLALTKELVELHGGTIAVVSEQGIGTKMSVSLPFGKSHLLESQIIGEEPEYELTPPGNTAIYQEESIELLENVLEPDGQKPIVLLIEDNKDVRNYIKTILSTTYFLLEAVDGEEGIQKAEEHIPDLIISDVMMPKMNGYDVCKYLKQEEKTAHIPVILLTAKASANSRIKGHETEADLYLSKPFVPKELLLCIHNLIQSRKKLRERYNKTVVLKPSDIAINSVDERFLTRLTKVVEANFEEETFSVDQLAKEMCMSRSQLHRKLHALTNESSSHFIRSFRLQRAMALLKKNNASISEIAYKVGFGSPSYFNQCFSKHFDCTPSSVVGSEANFS